MTFPISEPGQYNELPDLPKEDSKEPTPSNRYSATPKLPKSRENQVEYFQVDLQEGLERSPLPPIPPKRKFSDFELESTKSQYSKNEDVQDQSPQGLPIYAKSRMNVKLPPIPSGEADNSSQSPNFDAPKSPITPNFDNTRPKSPISPNFDNDIPKAPIISSFTNNRPTSPTPKFSTSNPPPIPQPRKLDNGLPLLLMTPATNKNNIPKTTIRIQKDPKPQIHLREIFQQDDPDHTFIGPPGYNSNSNLPPKALLTPSSVDSDDYYNLEDFEWDSAAEGGIDYDKLYNQYYKCLPRPRLIRVDQISSYIAEMHSRPGSFEQEYLVRLQICLFYE